jgi:hypothetical protein
MATSGKRQMTRKFLEAHTGDWSQFAGVRRYQAEEGRAAGSSFAEVWTGGGLHFTVALGRALDISSAFFNGKSLCWRSPAGDANAGLYDPQGLGWLKGFFGGLLTTCGLNHQGGPADVGGKHYGLHGPISNTPAEEVSCRTEWRGDDFVVVISGKVRQAQLFGEKLMLHRTITAQAFDKRIFIHDVVENTGHQRESLALLYHINPGYPVVEDGSRLLIDVAKIAPLTEHAADGIEDFDKFHAPTKGYAEKVYFITPKPAKNGEDVAAVVNKTRNLGVYVKWRHSEMPCFGEWKQMGYRDYVVGIEPCTIWGWPRKKLLDEKLMPYIAAGEKREFHVEIGVLDGRAEVDALAAKTGARGTKR